MRTPESTPSLQTSMFNTRTRHDHTQHDRVIQLSTCLSAHGSTDLKITNDLYQEHTQDNNNTYPSGAFCSSRFHFLTAIFSRVSSVRESNSLPRISAPHANNSGHNTYTLASFSAAPARARADGTWRREDRRSGEGPPSIPTTFVGEPSPS